MKKYALVFSGVIAFGLSGTAIASILLPLSSTGYNYTFYEDAAKTKYIGTSSDYVCDVVGTHLYARGAEALSSYYDQEAIFECRGDAPYIP